MENPKLIISKVFKARYFINNDIIEAPLGPNPSYIWRSLIWSRDILHKGIFWKVGKGDRINTRKDAWIPDLAGGKITSNTTYDNNTSVASLIRTNGGCDIDKLNNLYLPYEVEAIKKVPLSEVRAEDTRYRRFEKKKELIL